LLVLSCDQRVIVRSLTFVSGGEAIDGQAVEDRIRKIDFGADATDANTLALELAEGRPSARKEQQFLAAMRRQVWRDHGDPVPRWFLGLRRLRSGFDMDGLFVRPLLFVDGRSAGNAVAADADVELLAAMLNGTGQAGIRRDSLVMAEVDDQIHVDIGEGGEIRFTEMARRATRLALDVTNSDAAAIYLRDPADTSALNLVWHTTSTSAGDPITVPHRVAMTDGLLIAQVCSTHRAIQLPPGTQRKPDLQPTFRAPGTVTELGTPIPGPLASTDTPTAGGLVIMRCGRRDFSAYDLSLARNLSLRLALLRSTANASEIARAIADLRRPVHVSLPGPVEGPAGVRDDLPTDIKAGLARVQPALRQLAASTNSYSVSVRLAWSDIEVPEPHGFSLLRVAAHPPSRLHEREERQQQARDAGLNWKTAASGEFSYSPDVRDDKAYAAFRPETRSDLSVPLRQEGRLIGTLNLESRDLRNYASYLPQVEALAGAIGRSLADATAQETSLVLERAAAVLDHVHTLDKGLKTVAQLVRDAPMAAGAKREIEESLSASSALIARLVRDAPGSEPVTGDSTLAALLQEAISDARLFVLRYPDPTGVPALGKAVTATEAQRFRSACQNVLANLKDHTSDDTDFREISFDETLWGGREYVTLTFRNLSDRILDVQRAAQIYRTPVRSEHGTLRLGAYLTTLRLREIGGLVHFTVGETTTGARQEARTTVMIPK
jgi:GAF domain-containing protein